MQRRLFWLFGRHTTGMGYDDVYHLYDEVRQLMEYLLRLWCKWRHQKHWEAYTRPDGAGGRWMGFQCRYCGRDWWMEDGYAV
jgi:hypothetical protein